MASLEIHTVRMIQLVDAKAKWVLKDADVRCVNGTEYLKLKRSGPAYGFARIVMEHCSALIADKDKFTLTASKGYAKLMQMRNDAVAAEMRGIDGPPPCDSANALFGDTAPPEEKRPRMTLNTKREMWRNPEATTITIQSDDQPDFVLDVIRQVHPCDELTIKFDIESVTRVIDFLYDEGFNADLQRPSKNELPAGVWRMPKGKYAYKQMVNGRTIRKTAHSLEEAIEGVERERAKEQQPDGEAQV